MLFWTYLPPACGGAICGIVSSIRQRWTSGFHLNYKASNIEYVSTIFSYSLLVRVTLRVVFCRGRSEGGGGGGGAGVPPFKILVNSMCPNYMWTPPGAMPEYFSHPNVA